MKFDVKKVKTVATKHEVKDGDRGWCSDDIRTLKSLVLLNADLCFVRKNNDNNIFPFHVLGWKYLYFYPYKEPQYRPFSNAEEFKPYRSRWVKMKGSGVTRFNFYNNKCVHNDPLEVFNYQKLFDTCTFEDGSPCGVAL